MTHCFIQWLCICVLALDAAMASINNLQKWIGIATPVIRESARYVSTLQRKKDVWVAEYNDAFYAIIIIIIKAHPITCHEGCSGEQRYSFTLSLTSALKGGGWLTPLPGCSIPEKDQLSIVYEGRWAPWTVSAGAENLAPTGIRSPDRPGVMRLNLFSIKFPCFCSRSLVCLR